MRIMNTALYAIHKEISFFTPYIPSLIRNFFLNILTLMQRSANYMMNY